MTYHLARAAFWRQEGAVGYVFDPYDERLNVNPPNAEVALTFLLEVGRHERLAGFVQLVAALAIAVGVFALARKLGSARLHAAFGALLVLTLPIVLLQASTAQNDLVAASLLVAATVFVLGDSSRDLIIAALATALAIGTKIPAVYGLPVLAAVVLVAPPRSYLPRRLAAAAAGACIGSYWYVVNIIRTGHILGDHPSSSDLVAFLEPTENLLATLARTLDAFDLSGARGADLLVYAIVAAGVALALLVAPSSRTGGVVSAVATGALILAPLVFLPVGYALWRVFAKLHDVLGSPDGALPVRGWDAQTTASDSLSWFGPLGFLLVVGVGAASVVLVRRRSLPPLALVFAAAPVATFLLLGLSLGYDEWQGRFFIFPVALSASLWGLVLDHHRYAVATVAIALTTTALSLVNFTEKPSGLRLLEGPAPSSIWGTERWQAVSVIRSELGPVLRFVEREVPADAVVAVAAGEDDFVYPLFGPRITRRLLLVPDESDGRELRSAQWLVANAERVSEIDRGCWRLVHGGRDAWGVFRRARC